MSDFERIVDVIRGGRRFLITSHINPDGDAIGSQLALLHLLRSLDKEGGIVNHDPVPPSLAFLPAADEITGPGSVAPPYDATLLVDCGQFDRTGSIVEAGRAGYGTLVNIDHHATGQPWANLNWIDPSASSTAELVHRLIVALRGKPDLDMACCVYTGLLTDTGSFRYGNTSSRVLHLAAELVAAGVDPAMIATHVFDCVPYPTLKLLGAALGRLRISPDGLLSWMTVTDADLRRTGTGWEATEEFVNYPRSIPSVQVALLFKALSPDRIKVSLRSRGRIDVSRIALRHGGGGHVNAAGCVLQGSLASVRARIVAEVHQELLAHLASADNPFPEESRS